MNRLKRHITNILATSIVVGLLMYLTGLRTETLGDVMSIVIFYYIMLGRLERL